jgi:(p)ppGpp synthase/HD superfamily hydrolase
MTIASKARIYATAAHAAVGPVRKYTGESYMRHPYAVVNLVFSVPHTEEMIASAWLHDVVEDTQVTLDNIAAEFGPVVAAMVDDLTDVSRPGDGDRAAQKVVDRAHTSMASSQAKTIKLADIIDNTQSIVQYEPEFARVYLREKEVLLPVLVQGDRSLHKIATNLVYRGLKAAGRETK